MSADAAPATANATSLEAMTLESLERLEDLEDLEASKQRISRSRELPAAPPPADWQAMLDAATPRKAI